MLELRLLNAEKMRPFFHTRAPLYKKTSLCSLVGTYVVSKAFPPTFKHRFSGLKAMYRVRQQKETTNYTSKNIDGAQKNLIHR